MQAIRSLRFRRCRRHSHRHFGVLVLLAPAHLPAGQPGHMPPCRMPTYTVQISVEQACDTLTRRLGAAAPRDVHELHSVGALLEVLEITKDAWLTQPHIVRWESGLLCKLACPPPRLKHPA